MTRVLSAQARAVARTKVATVAAAGALQMPRSIVTERLRLLPIARHHLPMFAELFADAPSARFVGGPLDRADAFMRMAAFAGGWRLYGFGIYTLIDREDRPLGYAGLWFPQDKPEIEIAYGLVRRARGHGLGTEAVWAVRNAAIAAGAPSLVSYIAPGNGPSQAVARRAGASVVGRLRLGGHDADVWRYPVPERVSPEPADILLDAAAMPLTIRTQRLVLTQFRPDHFTRFFAHLSDEDTMRFIGGPKSLEQAARIFSAAAGAWALQGYGMYAVEAEGRFVGSVGLYHPDDWPEAELAYNITKDTRRRGFAAEAVRAVRDVAAEQGRTRLVSFIAPENHASKALARSVGAVMIGTTQFAGPPDEVWQHALPAGSNGPVIHELQSAA